MRPTRRGVLAAGAGALALLVVRPARATPETMAAAIREFTGWSEARKGRVALDIPALVENGNSVPLKVSVESPMTPDDFVTTIAVFNERNPQPNVANFHLTARAGRAEVSTRIRLGDSQKIVAVARLSDGSFWSDEAELVVTLPACVES
ncbi:SoxY-related AACIE arm protein [Microvirga massiliensis]|uniref:SoxY-related AACIE arm protein n=1 Tax=Microvirga massiliensis TaxID=1033741 RepID=UPI00062B5061|nr:SoxY-related AACIE arm protein [Microvirga massiliensis]